MTNRQKALLQESWARVAPQADDLARTFYGRLFELDPSVRRLFKRDMAAQRRKLIATIGTAVDAVWDLDAIVPILEALGRRHLNYGVRDADYPTVGAALLWALGEHLGPAFTAEVEEAWTAVYAILSETMTGAAAAAR